MSNGTTGVDEARNALGKRLRELRIAAKLSDKELAESLSWVGSKISKIENGKQTPTDDDIKDWTRATESEDQTASLLAALHNLELQHAEWQRVLKAGMKSHQLTLSRLDERTKFYGGFENTVIPGLIQTPEYARARFAQVVMVHRVPNDINEAVKARMQRQEMLYRPDKRFHFVITEAALRYRLVGRDIMIGQLDRLSLSTWPPLPAMAAMRERSSAASCTNWPTRPRTLALDFRRSGWAKFSGKTEQISDRAVAVCLLSWNRHPLTREKAPCRYPYRCSTPTRSPACPSAPGRWSSTARAA
jgi:transcriptional regulator with XRE-family HTH domain